jgi:hypothetical protein
MSENDNSFDNSYDRDVYGYDTSYDTGYGTGYDEPMVGPLDAPDKPTGLHPVNIAHLVMGVAFAGMVLVWALVQGDVVETDELRWMMPIPWIAAGAAGLAATVWPGRRASTH